MVVVRGQVTPASPRRVGPGHERKIALIGSAPPTQAYAPWEDPSWEIWSHASCYATCRRVDRWFELHPESKWRQKKTYHPDWPAWLAQQTVPVYMQAKHKSIPASVRYPKERILAEFPRYLTSQAAWMIALALAEGVTHLGFYGIHYALSSEYAAQRPGCEFWMGVALGRGVQLVVPDGAPLLREPPALYGFEEEAFSAWQSQWMRHPPKDTGIPAVVRDPALPLPPLPTEAPDGIDLTQMAMSRANQFWMLDTPPASSVPTPAGAKANESD